ncbi:MAG: CBS domain-containing protein [Gammaproteobacteria bacterium]|nr:CBS domain-containing protein [Gammaproteobacteria bacterium]MDH3370265.1 CBS domain-containing protein [Gammaproteobacteria bacterium]MDH3405360.1 CBS domain-containing protein [Gammaproteobacteria bacterium]MDH3562410.1 CBS domain-containing protein [Gammaproteobacteria bacterium]MDH5487245.1 CBS domain-containing protein [Gammaproteobacteria bacterium]
MNKKTEDKPETAAEPEIAPRSLLDRLSHALLGEPASREDLVQSLREAAGRDLLDRDSLDMIEGVLQVSEMKVRDIMVPRSQMDVVDKDSPPETYLPLVMESGHSRFPMVDGDKDRVIGILLAKDLLRYLFLDKKKRVSFNVHDMLRPAVFVPESKRLNVLLREFRTSRNHMAIVVNEYGGVAGLVTIEDVLEQIVGEISDEYDIDDDVMIMPRDGGEYVVKALVTLADLNSRLNTKLAHEEIETVGGLVMNRLGHVPRRGEKIEIDNLRFEVLRADSRRVYLLKVTPVEQPGRQKTKK